MERDAEGNPLNRLSIKGVEDCSDIKVIAHRLQEIEEKARTNGEYNKIGELYGFSVMVKTESSSQNLFDLSVNRFFVKGEGSIYYTYNNGKLANDPKLACLNFFNALERIPKVIESHEKEIAKVSANKEVYTAIANSSWKKEEDLRSLKAQAAELDRKIALTLSPPEEEEENLEKEVQETRYVATSTSLKDAGETSLSDPTTQTHQDNREVTSRVVISKPKLR